MSDPLRKALSGLRALAGDYRSGAGEIADRATALLEEFCRQVPRDDSRLPARLSELAEVTLTLQPSMAPLLNLANRVQFAAEQDGDPVRTLQAALEKFRRQRQQASTKIGHLFATRLRRRSAVLAYSYSSTVLAALLAAAEGAPGGRRLERVILSECRPLYEGRVLAERLGAKGIDVTLVIDILLPEQMATADAVVVGADAVFEGAYVNKAGTRLLQEQARTSRTPFFVLADTAKLLPPALAPFHHLDRKPAQQVWREAPPGVTVVNHSFEIVPLQRHVTLLTERGMMPPPRVRAWVESQEVARRWKEAHAGGRRP